MRRSCPFSAADCDIWRWELRQIVRSIAESVTGCRDWGATLPALQACACNHSGTCPVGVTDRIKIGYGARAGLAFSLSRWRSWFTVWMKDLHRGHPLPHAGQQPAGAGAEWAAHHAATPLARGTRASVAGSPLRTAASSGSAGHAMALTGRMRRSWVSRTSLASRSRSTRRWRRVPSAPGRQNRRAPSGVPASSRSSSHRYRRGASAARRWPALSSGY